MNCYYHPDTPARAFCRTCGRGLCDACQRLEAGTVLCPEHAATPEGGSTYTSSAGTGAPPPYAPPAGTVHTYPLLAAFLGFIPGVGAIYNGQYTKGLVHAVIFGLFATILSNSEDHGTAPLFGILLSAFIFYMVFDAYHTARRRELGLPVEEWSILRGSEVGRPGGGNGAVGPVVLIGVGVLFLLDTLNLLSLRALGRYWPVLLIAVGTYMLYNRTVGTRPQSSSNDYVGDRQWTEGARREQ